MLAGKAFHWKQHLPCFQFGTHVPTKHIFPLDVTEWNLAMAISDLPLCGVEFFAMLDCRTFVRQVKTLGTKPNNADLNVP